MDPTDAPVDATMAHTLCLGVSDATINCTVRDLASKLSSVTVEEAPAGGNGNAEGGTSGGSGSGNSGTTSNRRLVIS